MVTWRVGTDEADPVSRLDFKGKIENEEKKEKKDRKDNKDWKFDIKKKQEMKVLVKLDA